MFLGPGSVGGSQQGPLIVDHQGAPVWFLPLSSSWAANFAPGEYRGEPVLTWWEGKVILPLGYGKGEGVIVDSSYRELGRVRAANGRQMDVHEFQITPQGTALFACYPRTVQHDLSEVGGPRDGHVLESLFQEVDLETGRLLLEWRSLDHIPVTDSYRPVGHPYDYLHLNSIDIAPDGHLLVSARHTFAAYKLDRRTGEVIWRLGGKQNQFAISPVARFSWQHDARYVAGDTITLFDNGSDGPTKTEPQSRGLVLAIDSLHRTAQLAASYPHASPLTAVAMGNLQMLPGGDALVGWGSQPYATEFTAGGGVMAEVGMTRGQQSYRAFRLPWKAAPATRPAVSVRRTKRGPVLYASWNGATELTHWQVHVGPSPRSLVPIRMLPRRGFETALPIEADSGYAAVTAHDGTSRELGRSRPAKL
jgi:hypothetical protein